MCKRKRIVQTKKKYNYIREQKQLLLFVDTIRIGSHLAVKPYRQLCQLKNDTFHRNISEKWREEVQIVCVWHLESTTFISFSYSTHEIEAETYKECVNFSFCIHRHKNLFCANCKTNAFSFRFIWICEISFRFAGLIFIWIGNKIEILIAKTHSELEPIR